jgi:multiple sugar transport system ATP-binding protein
MNGAAVDGGVLKLERPVDYYEKSGADAIAFLSLPSGPISVRVDGRHSGQFRGAETMPALLQLSKINVFDAQSGRRM